ncbi:MAG TPA: hypothetical protein VLV49_03885 [Terriglobales bacterium]|nr:hypothetical protein [Terriglobales bacterium]
MKVDDLIRDYFDNALSAQDAAQALAAISGGSARRARQMVETDAQLRQLLEDFEPPEGAEERLGKFVRSRNLVKAPEVKRSRLRRLPVSLGFEVVGFQKSEKPAKPRRRRKPKAKRPKKRK